jgi:large subunit ribosomal protein L4
MAAPKAPVLDGDANKARDVSLDAAVFAAEVKAHLVHAAVRSELNARRAGTKAAKSRGMVRGGRGKPWRQKGTGRARAGTIRAPQFTGGGVAFAPTPRTYGLKVNRKEFRSALRAALTQHAKDGTFGILPADAFTEPSTRAAAEFVEAWGKDLPLVVVTRDEEAVVKSFRNLDRVFVTTPSELEVAALVWANSLLVTEDALPLVQERAS